MTEPATSKTSEALREELSHLDRREWSLWVVAVFSLLLMCVAVASLALPGLREQENLFFAQKLDIAVSSLFGIVFLFTIFALYQQYLIKGLRARVARELVRRAAVETRAAVLEELATHDELTGLFNRRYAMEQLAAEAARSDRNGYPLSVLVLDLDDFKDVNDQHGHAAGDQAFKEFSRWLRRAIRSSDVPVRMGGDEFMVLLPECDISQTSIPVTRMQGCKVDFDGSAIAIHFSSAWAQREKGESTDAFLRRADQALYENKRQRQLQAVNPAGAPL